MGVTVSGLSPRLVHGLGFVLSQQMLLESQLFHCQGQKYTYMQELCPALLMWIRNVTLCIDLVNQWNVPSVLIGMACY